MAEINAATTDADRLIILCPQLNFSFCSSRLSKSETNICPHAKPHTSLDLYPILTLNLTNVSRLGTAHKYADIPGLFPCSIWKGISEKGCVNLSLILINLHFPRGERQKQNSHPYGCLTKIGCPAVCLSVCVFVQSRQSAGTLSSVFQKYAKKSIGKVTKLWLFAL